MGLRFEILQRRILAEQESTKTIVALVPVEKDPSQFPFVGPYLPVGAPAGTASTQIIADTLRRDDSIYLSLKRNGVSEYQIARLTQALEKVFKSKSESKPKDHYTLETDTSGAIQYFEYTPHLAPQRPVLIERQDGQLTARRLDLPLQKEIAVIEARIEDNLYNAIHAMGEGDYLIDKLADDIFGAVIDFHKNPRQGDRIGIVFEKLYLQGRFIHYGRVLMANYEGRQVSQLAVHYEDPQGHWDYYDSKGQSLARMFLLNPLPYRKRISSSFNRRRFHPILKKPIPHLGTDYAAPAGTQVRATARGQVVHAGRKGGFGKMVEIEHANGFRTRYAHLSRIAVRNGQHVPQKHAIGRVGSTGRATGPHLHYELIKNGRHKNPEKANQGGKGTPLHKRYQQDFATRRDTLLSLLATGIPSRQFPFADIQILASGEAE